MTPKSPTDYIRIVADQKSEVQDLLDKSGIIERDVPKDRLKKYLSAPNILAVLGVRRCGKSVLSHLLLKGRKYGFLNFDDERLAGTRTEDMNNILEALYHVYDKPEYLLFDELHNVPGWELFVNRMRRSYRVVVTGSNAKMISGELATHLTGRYIDFTLFPFSFKEYLRFKGHEKVDTGTTLSEARAKRALKDYIEVGGFPEVYSFGKGFARKIYSDIVHKDILNRYDIRNGTSFEEMARYLISNSAMEFSYSKLKNIFDLKRVETARKYVSYLTASYLVIVLSRYSSKLKQQIIAPRKAYCIDTGMVRAVGFAESNNFGPNFENIVAVELMRRMARQANGSNCGVFYWKDHQGKEVDFVIKEGTTVRQLIQVAYELDGDVRRRELDALLRASVDLNCKNLVVITGDHEGIEKAHTNGIEREVSFIPLWKWL
jgi:predicted AAA+ superfamily ATPase